jgi:3-oxoacyl-[acyl-carrier-protein] synthase-3
VLTNADLAQMVDTSDEWIITRSGIRERHIVGPDESNSQMATDAAREALCVAGMQGHDLDLIIVATTTPDYLTPPVSSQIQDALGAHNVGAFTMSVGCPGFLYGLATGSQFIQSGPYQRVLVVGVEIISRFTNYKDRATCVLFGDGAGAVVLRAVDQPCGVLSHVLGSDGSGHHHIIVPAGGSRHPPSAEALEGDLHFVQMNGREVFKFATRVVGRAIDQALERAGLTIDDVDLIIPHQANLRIIESAAQYYGVPLERFFVNIDRYGNTSAASIPIALCEAIEQGRAKAGDTLAFVAFGAGLTWAATIVRL